ncbi:6-phosphogluconolactonase [Planctomycetes bacterium Pla163]|uniref:6-phosphogluconolactonase n=1 Tax=Rohdeia mirabilis TaxID=2528008 RepID=A0A518CZD5_9BACT|nr:6-phosphogluconolactonase [Planctomycetes bacterium Pla163]
MGQDRITCRAAANTRTAHTGRFGAASISLALALFAAGCSGGSGSGGVAPVTPPVTLTFASTQIDMLAGVVAPPSEPTYQGGAADFTVVPALPDGLYLNAASGEIHGLPTTVSPRTNYTITARNEEGFLTADVEIEVHASFDEAAFVYALHPQSDEISLWRVDAGTGTLVPAGRTRTGNLPVRATVDPLGRFLYVVCGGQESVVVHHIDPLTGELDPVQLAAADGAAFDIAIDPTGRFLYKSNLHVGTLQAFAIDATSGRLVKNGAPVQLPGPSALEISGNGRNLFAGTLDGQAVLHFVVDSVTGEVGQFVGSAPIEGPVDLLFDETSDLLYALDFTNGSLVTYELDAVGGRPTVLFDTPVGGAPASIVKVGDQLHVGMHSPAGVLTFDVDPVDGRPIFDQALPLAGSATKIERFGTDGATMLALDGAALVAQVTIDGAGDLEWSDRRPCKNDVTDLVVVHGPRAFELETAGLFTATAQSLELSGYRTNGGGLDAAGLPVPIGLDPSRLVIDETRNQLVAVSRGSDQISTFSIDPVTLQLDELATVQAGLEPRDARLTASGRWLASLDADRVALWSMADDGQIAVVDSESVGSMPRHLTIDPADRFVYVSEGDTVRLFELNTEAGTLTPAAGGLTFANGSQPSGMCVSPDGRFLVICLEGTGRMHVAEIDRNDGSLTSRSTLETGFRSTEPSFDGRGARLITVEPDEDRVSLYGLDDAGTVSLQSRALCGSDANAVAFDRQGANVYGAAQGSDTIEIFSVDGSNLTSSSQVQVGLDTSPQVVTGYLVWSPVL